MSIMLRRRHRIPERPEAGVVWLSSAGLSVRLGDALVLRDIDLDVRCGEVLALVGPNGAGKSTLLSALSGDASPESGAAILDGVPVDRWSALEQAMRRAVLLQHITLSFPFTVTEVVAMGRTPWAGTALEDYDEEAIADAIRATDVEEFAHRQFSTLSGGEKARVALARVLAQRTSILLLDEPTAALDLHHQELVMRIVRSRASAGHAVVVVLHDLNLAAAHADQVAVLSWGELAAYGPPASVLTADVLSEVYHHPVEVMSHPRTAAPVILPSRFRPDPATPSE